MQININNQSTETQATNLQELSVQLSLPEKGVAIAVSNRMVPHTAWANTPLTEGANVVIIKAACGG